MKESRKAAKEGGSSVMADMRKRYERAVEAERDNRELALADLKFVTVPGHQWDEAQKAARKGRPCYEFPILRSHWRQVVNDQKKARPGIKVRAVEDGDAKGAELRQGLIRNIESRSNAERAYDAAFESMTACGMGVWRIATEYSTDDSWDQDLCVRPIPDPLSSVWFDPDAKSPDCRDAMYAFVEETMSRDAFKAKYPKAQTIDFESDKKDDWFGKDAVRVAEYWRKVPITKTLWLLSDGRTVDAQQADTAQLIEQGVTILRERVCNTHKVVMSIVSGVEEIDGPHDSVFDRIPIVPIFANRHFIEGKWTWCGMVRFSRDPQKLLNYNLTTAQETVSKQPKSPYLVTPAMLEGPDIKAIWDKINAVDVPYLPYTPDPKAPGSAPTRLSPPDMPAAFTMLTQISVDMLKASDGIFDESQGKASNATSGKAIIARQQEGDTATFDYQDALTFGIQSGGEILLGALPKVYDTPRAMRVLGKDGGEDWVQLYQETQDPQTGQPTVLNDLSAGKYDVTITTGASYDTQRMEFVDALVQMSQGNELVAQAVPDLIIGSMDFPKADEAAERLKALLPPPIQQMLAKGKELPPEAMMAMQQAEQAMRQVQEQMQAIQQAVQEVQQQEAQVGADKAQVAAQRAQIQADIKVAQAQFEAREAKFEAAVARAEAQLATKAAPQEQPEGTHDWIP